MRWPRLRFTLGQLMIAVATIPIVLTAGNWAGNRWPTIVVHDLWERDRPEDRVTRDYFSRYVEITEFSNGSAAAAMAATLAILAMLWVGLGRWKKRE
jgi:hypothetical protein